MREILPKDDEKILADGNINNDTNEDGTIFIPMLALKGLTVFPGNKITFDVGREKSIKALEKAMGTDSKIFLVTQKSVSVDDPNEDDVFKMGTICQVKQLMRFTDDRLRVLVEGIKKAEIIEISEQEPFLSAKVLEIDDEKPEEDEKEKLEALFRTFLKILDEYEKLNPKVIGETIKLLLDIEDIRHFTYEAASILPIGFEQKQTLLEEATTQSRLESLLLMLSKELEIFRLEKEIAAKVQKQLETLHKEQFLREQIKVIQNELGEGDSSGLSEYKSKIEAAELPLEVKEKAIKELGRLERMNSGYAEAQILRTYLDLILDLPWSISTEESDDLIKAEEILNRDHYGLEKVKERILEYLAVNKFKKSLHGPIICLLGPPGVGKTSIARSIAESLNRKYVRMSLGGMKDEAEIRGHRKTYIGAMPGRIITSIKTAGSNNPLILLDEIDKLGNDYKGDPSSALLEVLDSEQNSTFRDNFLELPFDLSKVLFMTTANGYEGIPRALLDRMEVIEVSSYTDEEKFNIAKKYLFPKQVEIHGLSIMNITIDDDAIFDVINGYTSEAGVRNLERECATICRKIARALAMTKRKSYKVSQANLIKLLGSKKRLNNKALEKDEIGVATGLAWTSVGGVTLSIEVNVLPGTGRIDLTGRLGDVMKESAKAALSYIRSRADSFGIEQNFYEKHDIHIHIPEGGTPKDGPSAGITMATAIVSALTGNPVKKTVAMTGEITLRGKVLPIGGLKEKSLAALRIGIKTIIIPIDNKKDVEELPASVKKGIKFIYAQHMDEVLKIALCRNVFKTNLSKASGNDILVKHSTQTPEINVENVNIDLM